MTNTDTLQLVYVNIHSKAEWKQWYRIANNNTYVITHDPAIWHVSTNGNVCVLHKRISQRFTGWAGAKCLIRHDSDQKLWVTLKLPDNFCSGGCGKRLRPHKSECMSCLIKRYYASKPFYDNYQIKELTVISSDFERGYRLFKYMGVKDKLVLHHLDCKSPNRCYHFKWFINRNRETLPFYKSKVQGTQTEMVKIIK